MRVAIDLVFMRHKTTRYNIGGFNEWQNIDLVKLLCKIMDEKLGRSRGFRTIDFICKRSDMTCDMH
jgi:dTDP-D-glucose 4,6-dehydratase